MNQILIGCAFEKLQELPDKHFHTVVCSPPYFNLRDYSNVKQIGHEKTYQEYIRKLVLTFKEVHRVLRDDGTLWIVIGDTYNNQSKKDKLTGELKRKDLIGIPWRLAFALQEDGWYLRQDIIWNKPNPTPQSVRDRCTTSHEYIFLLSKNPIYYFDAEAISEPTLSLIPGHKSFRPRAVEIFNNGRTEFYGKRGKTARTIKERKNKRSVWTVTTKPSKTSHTATFPKDLIEDCIKAGTSKYGVCSECGSSFLSKDQSSCEHKKGPVPARVLDPFFGSGTTGEVALKLGREYTGIELNETYAKEATERLSEKLFY
ncbi:site-specific DNA-methyltransferase [Leptospira sp. FAT2]|uniref:DNA-methyltransferase n=1 Tax=Leptospira sanjuanensis TaxID=2879643 RepID=UPI001EE95EE7|nr:DNA methyltransferase [Leptospira sanjuanensis]MCG6195635.1 site-specific DNA-methyltransferase [Leptospira sanjuanensis]